MYKYKLILVDGTKIEFESYDDKVNTAYLDYCIEERCVPQRLYDYQKVEMGKPRAVKSIHEDIF